MKCGGPIASSWSDCCLTTRGSSCPRARRFSRASPRHRRPSWPGTSPRATSVRPWSARSRSRSWRVGCSAWGSACTWRCATAGPRLRRSRAPCSTIRRRSVSMHDAGVWRFGKGGELRGDRRTAGVATRAGALPDGHLHIAIDRLDRGAFDRPLTVVPAGPDDWFVIGPRVAADALMLALATATGRPACCRHRCEQWLCRAAPGGTAGARRPCAGLSAGPASAHLQNRSVCRIALLQGVCLDLAKRRGVFIRTAGAPKFRRLCPPDAGARHARERLGGVA